MLLKWKLDEVLCVSLTENVIPYHFKKLPPIIVISLIIIIVALTIIYIQTNISTIELFTKEDNSGSLDIVIVSQVELTF